VIRRTVPVLRVAAFTILAMTTSATHLEAQAVNVQLAPADSTTGPEAVVRAFMADYLAWNDRAHREAERAPEDQDMDRAEAEYDALLRRYCRPGFTGQLIAFGSESAHDPAKEAIVSAATRGDTSVVRTRQAREPGGFASEFEYHLLFQDGRWYLEQVYYVGDDGKHPTL
jgi:hypothetical protein